jgi:polysaccharide biosynthesis/export protein
MSRIMSWALTAALLASAAHGEQTSTDAPASAAPAMPAAAATPPVVDTNVAPDYRIGPGDTLQVFVWRNGELSVTVPVRPDGRISTPLNEDMQAVGKTPTALARDIETKLSEFLKKPTVNIIVTHPISLFSQVSIVGQVKSPGGIPFQEGLTVMQAVLAVGGPGEFGALKRTKVLRKGAGGVVKAIKVNLYNILQKGDMSSNITLQAGDVVVIPESHF